MDLSNSKVAKVKRDFLSTLADSAKRAIPTVMALLSVVGPVLPRPGGPEAAELLRTVLGLVQQAQANKDNLTRLANRCTDLMGLTIAKLQPAQGDTLAALDAADSTSNTSYTNITNRFLALLQKVKAYTQAYCTEQSFLYRMLNSSNDKAEYLSLTQSLSELVADATYAVGVDAHGVTLEIKAAVLQIQDTLQTQLTYTDHSAALKAFVDRVPGGIDAIVADPALTRQAIAELELSQQLAVRLNSQAVRDALKENGVHRNITQPELSSLWYKYFTGRDEVTWDLFWLAFPRRMNEFLPSSDYQQLVATLASNDAKLAFQAGVDGGDQPRIEVGVLGSKFVEATPLVAQVQQILNRMRESSTQARAEILQLWSRAQRLWIEARAWWTSDKARSLTAVSKRNEQAEATARKFLDATTDVWVTFESGGLLNALRKAREHLTTFKQNQQDWNKEAARRGDHDNNYAAWLVDEAVKYFDECVKSLDGLTRSPGTTPGGAGPSHGV